MQKFKATGDSRYMYGNELACFQHEMVHEDFKDLRSRAVCDKVLRNKAFQIACNPSMMNINVNCHQWSTDIFDKKAKDTSTFTGTGISEDQQLTNELHRPITREFKKRKIYSLRRDNIWDADLANMQLLSKYN